MPARNELEAPLEIPAKFDSRQIPILRESIDIIKKRKLEEEKIAREKEKAFILMPKLNKAVIDLVNESIEITNTHMLFAPNSHQFIYEIPVDGQEYPLRVNLFAEPQVNTKSADVTNLRYFDISEEKQPFTFKTSRTGPRIEDKYNVSKWDDRPLFVDATDDDVETHIQFVKGLSLGIVQGVIKVRRANQI